MAKGLKINGLAAVLSGLSDLAEDMGTDKSYAVGSPVNYGATLERGTRRHPPYPWLSPSVENVKSRGNAIFQQSENVDQFVKLVALEIQREATRRLESGSIRPFRQTGNLAGSVEIVETK